jgi:anhydro-N-acetylmuramic acid kinase
MKVIGLMSRTSLDGVDIALIETDGEHITAFGPTGYRNYAPEERDLLRKALDAGQTLNERSERPGVLRAAEAFVTAVHGETVETFLRTHGLEREDIDFVGFHGQTVLHRPEQRLTVQIGDGNALAKALRIPVVYDFRAADVAAGGQGAPIASVYHRALVAGLVKEGPVAVLNIGGVANVTYVEDGRDPIACDTGPGNALIDDFMRARTGRSYDDNGDEAAQGKVDEDFVEAALQHDFFDAKCPKSLDREAFTFVRLGLPDVSIPDGAATLSALTAATVAHVVTHLPEPPRRWFISGGGARNKTLMRMLSDRLAPAGVETADDAGWSADAIEAQAFAYLAARAATGLPLTFPTTTGVDVPMTGGVIARP